MASFRSNTSRQDHGHGSPSRGRLPSFAASSPIAEASIARDLADDPDDDPFEESDDDSNGDLEAVTNGQTTLGSAATGIYRRASMAAARPRLVVMPNADPPAQTHLTKAERELVREEERSLLRDNNVIPPKHPQSGTQQESIASRLGRRLPIPSIPGGDRKVVEPSNVAGVTAPDELGRGFSETAPLLGDPEQPYGGQDTPENINRKWEEAVAAGLIHTTWQREAKVIGKYAAPLIVTFLLQYSLTVASIFSVGHIGKVELGAVSLASMTAGITGFAVYQGLVTSLDTLCAQAYGSGRKKLVGLQMQRMIYFLWAITIPIAILWYNAEHILCRIVPEPEIAVLAGQYLKILILGAPGYACFESGKRFVQAQGLFSASLYVLLICAPLNAFMNWLFVWVCSTLLLFKVLPVRGARLYPGPKHQNSPPECLVSRPRILAAASSPFLCIQT